MARSKSSGRDTGEPKSRDAGAEPRASGAKRAPKSGTKPGPTPDAAPSAPRGRERARPAPGRGSEAPDAPTSVLEALLGVECIRVAVHVEEVAAPQGTVVDERGRKLVEVPAPRVEEVPDPSNTVVDTTGKKWLQYGPIPVTEVPDGPGTFVDETGKKYVEVTVVGPVDVPEPPTRSAVVPGVDGPIPASHQAPDAGASKSKRGKRTPKR